MDREAAPARSDFQEMVVGSKVELVGDLVHLPELGRFEVFVTFREHGRRIVHRAVQEEREEIVAEVVVGGDLLLAARAGGPWHQHSQTLDWTGDESETSAEAIKPG